MRAEAYGGGGCSGLSAVTSPHPAERFAGHLHFGPRGASWPPALLPCGWEAPRKGLSLLQLMDLAFFASTLGSPLVFMRFYFVGLGLVVIRARVTVFYNLHSDQMWTSSTFFFFFLILWSPPQLFILKIVKATETSKEQYS